MTENCEKCNVAKFARLLVHLIKVSEENKSRDLSKHIADSWPGNAFFRIHIVQVILYELNRCGEICLIKFVRYIPTERSKFSPLLHDGV